MSLSRPLAPALLLTSLALGLAACGGDDDQGGQADTVPATTAPATEGPAAGPEIEFETVQRLTPEYLGEDPECPEGEFAPTPEPLTTLPDEDAARAVEPPQSYSCGGRVDQVIYARFDDPAQAERLLDPTNTSNAASLVAGTTAVLVNFGVRDTVDIAGFFQAIQEECGCGETRYEAG